MSLYAYLQGDLEGAGFELNRSGDFTKADPRGPEYGWLCANWDAGGLITVRHELRQGESYALTFPTRADFKAWAALNTGGKAL